MAVCRLAILSYRDNQDYGGYDKIDLLDCIRFAEWQLEVGITTGSDGQDWQGFIKWAKSKLVIPYPATNITLADTMIYPLLVI